MRFGDDWTPLCSSSANMTIDAYACGRWTTFTGDRPLHLPPRILVAKKKVYYIEIPLVDFWGEPKELHPTKLEVFSFRCFAYCYCLNLFE